MLYSIILPVYNQVQNLPLILYLLYEIVLNNNLQIEIIIVEDNSPDGTLLIANKLVQFYCQKYFNINVITRKQKLGLGSAYREGLKYCQGQYVIIMDADLSHHPKYIPIMISQQSQQKAHIITGTRYAVKGGVQGWNFMRKLISRTANYITKLIIPVNYTDLTGSYRLYDKKILSQLMPQCNSQGYAFQMEILIRAHLKKLKIVQTPIIFVDRLYGKSKLGINQVWLYLKGLARLLFLF